LGLLVHSVTAGAFSVLSASCANVLVTGAAHELRSTRGAMSLVAFGTAIPMWPEIRWPMAIAAHGNVCRKLMGLVTGFTRLVRRGRSLGGKFALFTMTAATAHRCERCCVSGVARATHSVLRRFCVGYRLQDGLMTVGADLGLALVFVRLVARGAFFVAVSTLRHVAGRASGCRGLTRMAAVTIQAVCVRCRFPRRERCLNRRVALDATRSLGPESVRGVATRAALMFGRQLRFGRLWYLGCVTAHAEIGCLGSWAMNRVALRAISVRRYVGLVVLVDDLAVARRAVVAMAPIDWVGSMRLVT